MHFGGVAAWQVPRLCFHANDLRYPSHRINRRGHSLYGMDTMHCPPLRPVRLNSIATELRMAASQRFDPVELLSVRRAAGKMRDAPCQIASTQIYFASCVGVDLYRTLEINPRVLCFSGLRRPTVA